MNLAEKARAIANDRNQKIQTAIQEITNYFKEYLNGKKFEQLIESKISEPRSQKDGYSLVALYSDYEHVEGREEKVTVINLGRKMWICPDNFYETYGISFDDIETEVCRHLHAITKDKLREMGFTAEQHDPTDEPWMHTYFWVKFSW